MPAPWYQTAFGAHYPLLYAHRNEAEARNCLDLLPRLAPLHTAARKPLLDLGCGDGRHLRWLVAAGEWALGLDLSPHLLARARNLGPGVPLIQGDMRDLPLAAGSVDSVLSLFTAFGYFGDLPASAPVVAGVARVLAAGGHWFLDYFDCEQVTAELGDGVQRVRQRDLGPLAVTETRTLALGARQVVKMVSLQPRPGHAAAAQAYGVGPAGLRYEERVALFSLAEMEALASAHHLRQVTVVGGYQGEDVGRGSRWLMVFRKDEIHD